jgi:hypothetical protein
MSRRFVNRANHRFGATLRPARVLLMSQGSSSAPAAASECARARVASVGDSSWHACALLAEQQDVIGHEAEIVSGLPTLRGEQHQPARTDGGVLVTAVQKVTLSNSLKLFV